nr:wall-associated receptor kinase-like 1 isoform X3 [Coffea arabica]
MEQIIKVLPFLKPRREKEEDKLSYFFKNGSSTLEEVIASFGGRYELPIRSFAAEELIKATNKFSERVRSTNIGDMFAGNLKERPVLVKFYSGLTKNSSWNETAPDRIIRDIVVTSQVSHLKNVLQLVGCCLEFAYPAMVYYYAPGSEFLTNRLRLPNNDGETDAIKYDEEMGGRIYIQDYVKRHILNNQFNQIVDQNMFKQQGNYNEPEVQQQLLDFLDLALRCTEHDRVDRPDMIEVAKLLRQMEKSVRCS